MGKGIPKKLATLADAGALRGHDRGGDSVLDPGHDLHGKGKGLGHVKNGGRVLEVEVDEGAIAVTDLDHSYRTGAADDGVTYDLGGGEDGALFSIDPDTGELSFLSPAPFTEGGDNTYEVVVVTSVDGRPGTVRTTVLVTVDGDDGQGASNAAPDLSVVSAVDPITNRMGGTTVAELLAFDANVEDTLVFTITGDDAAAFQVVRDAGDTDPTDGIDLDLIVNAASVTSKQGAGDDGIFNITVTVTDDEGASDTVNLSFDLQILSA